MATKQITTWDEFKTALTETITENTIYEIMNDIDVSDIILTSAINCTYSTSYQKLFKPTEGKDKITINGITSYSSHVIFNFLGLTNSNNNGFNFNNIHFSNIMAPNNILFQISTSGGSNQIRFNSCLFNGICRSLSDNNQTMNNTAYVYSCLDFDSCSFNISSIFLCKVRNYSGIYTYFNNCYIIIDDTLTGTVSDYFSTRFHADNTYFGGKYRTTSTGNMLFFSYCYNCVFNVEVTTSGSIISVNTGAYCLFNADKMPSYLGSLSNCYFLTDEQLKSKTYIQKNTNFPLYG